MLDHLLGLLPGGKVRQVRTAQEEAAFTMEPGGAPEAPRLLLFPSKPSVSPLLKSLALEFEVRSAATTRARPPTDERHRAEREAPPRAGWAGQGQVVVGQVSAKEGADASALERKYGVSERPAYVPPPRHVAAANNNSSSSTSTSTSSSNNDKAPTSPRLRAARLVARGPPSARPGGLLWQLTRGGCFAAGCSFCRAAARPRRSSATT
eukprot:scaffold3363_cov285-Prasinococcus_capsulatus_cf.AAC.3